MVLKRIYSLIFLGILFVTASAFAGSFTPSPITPGAGSYTLSDIYNKISLNSFSYFSHSFSPAIAPSNTYVTLSQIWNIIPPHKTLTAHSLDSGILPASIFSTTADLKAAEPNLVASNIAAGKTIFGIVGTYVPSNASLSLDVTPPSVVSFTISSFAVSLAVNVTGFVALDDVAVTGYLLTETSSKPLASDSGWASTAPTKYTFSSAGSKILYAWVKDAAGNISAPVSRSTSIVFYTWSANYGSQSFSGASSACASLGSGWRLPTKDEIVAAMTDQVNGGTSPGDFLSGTAYWTTSYDNYCGGGAPFICTPFISGSTVKTIQGSNQNVGSTRFRCIGPAPAEFSSGNGSVSNPYQISSWTQLNNVRNHLSSNYVLNNDLSNTTVGYVGIGDNWTPIPTFSGNFNGNSKIISDLVINKPSVSSVGLFSDANGNISNLGLVNVNIEGSSSVGGLVGNQSGGTISNSYSTGNVTASSYAGGLVGTQAGTISSSYSKANVSGFNRVGGLVGNCFGIISNSYATGNVIGTKLAGYLEGATNVGGLVGLLGSGTITNSYSTGSVTGWSSLGGLVGQSTGVVSNSYWDRETSGMKNSAGGTRKTTAEMKTQGTFAGWDFSSIWDITDSYPFLR